MVGENQTLEPRKVTVIREEGEYFYISSGLKADDKLVVTLPEYPQKGMEVKIAGAQPAPESSDVSTLNTQQL